MVQSRYIVVTEEVIDQGNPFRLVLSTRTNRSFRIPARQWQYIESGNYYHLQEKLQKTLCDALILVPSNEYELQSIIQRNRESITTNQKLLRCIQPTANCQLECNYCGQEHSTKTISEENQNIIIENLDKQLSSKKYLNLEIEWFGGEPILGMNVIRRMTPLLHNIAEKHGCEYHAGITTNGLAMSSDVAKELYSELYVNSFQVTIDGPEEVHNARRHGVNGINTFSKIYGNCISLAKDEQFLGKILIRCNVDHGNANRITELIELLASSGLQHRFIVYFASIHDWNDNNAHTLALPPDEFADLEIDWMAMLALNNFKPSLIPETKPIVCMAVCNDWRTIDPMSQVFNCVEVPLSSSDTTEQHSLGTVLNPHESNKATELSNFNENILNYNFDCATCTILPICAGWCPKKWFSGHKPCPPWRYNIKERLLLAYALRHHSFEKLS